MNDYPAPDPDNPQIPTSWGTSQNDYTFPSQDRQQPSPYQPHSAAYSQQPGYQPHSAAYSQQPGYQPQPAAYSQQPGYQPQYAAYGQQPGYQPLYAPIVPVVAVYDPYAGQALAGMIIGIIALVLPIFWIMPILGIIFSSLGMKSTTRKGMAIAGLVCSIIAIATAFCWFPFFFL